MVGRTRKRLLSNHLLLPPTMRDFASCFSENAVKISDASCSGSSSGGLALDGTSVVSAVICVYGVRLSTLKELLIRVAWSKSHVGPALSIGIDDSPSLHCWKPDAMSCQLLRKKKGARSYVSGKSAVVVHWDLSFARYGSSGPEPIDNFYVVVMVNAEFGLLLGDMSKEHIRRFGDTIPTAEFSMISRKEQVLGHSRHSTTSRFRDAGRDHEITVRCKGDGCDAKDSELSVCIDRKRVVQVRKLRWNFRGNQTVFVEGSPVDVMWDVHDWWFGNPSGCAMFMFRTRSSPESRLWSSSSEEEMSGFSLVIQAFRSP
ncbi:uncharacterized protein LOC135644800 [Musa acuminata AAA Group]|uniref:uncharacterized protein LOC135644800 n=1 Tax=Musa acuminata AAA Group TaxID=214697 RepID=UPI0031DB99DF